jgi:hypothetical protein
MTAEERSQIAALTQAMNDLRVQVVERLGALEGKFRAMCETTNLEIEHLKHQCDERHGANAKAIENLGKEERASFGLRSKLAGMGVPVAICVSVVAVILNIFL